MRTLTKFFSRSSAERRSLVEAFMLVLFVRIGLTWFPFRRLLGWLQRIGVVFRWIERQWFQADQLVRAVAATSKRIPRGDTCLVQALVAHTMLRHHGFDPSLAIGVTKEPDGSLRAHAWVELDGKVVIGEADLDTFQRLPSIATFK